MTSYWQQWSGFSQPGWRQLLLFKAGWFGLVLQPVYSAALVAVLLCWFIPRLTSLQRRVVLTLWATGLLLDTLLVYGGLFAADSVWLPYWLVLLWGWFSLFWTMVFSRWLQSALLVALFGLIGGPMAYWGGSQLSDSLQITPGAEFWLVMAPAWAALLLWSRQCEAWFKSDSYKDQRSRNNAA